MTAQRNAQKRPESSFAGSLHVVEGTQRTLQRPGRLLVEALAGTNEDSQVRRVVEAKDRAEKTPVPAKVRMRAIEEAGNGNGTAVFAAKKKQA